MGSERVERTANDADSSSRQHVPSDEGAPRPSLNIQPTLEVGPSNDPFEREADEVAARVVRSLRSPSTGEQAPDGELPDPSSPPHFPSVNPRIRRAVNPGATIGMEGGALDSETDRKIRAVRASGGRPLDAGSRTTMESAMGADFKAVRVHEGPIARQLNERIQATAFTAGNHVFFRDGAPNTRTTEGQHLLAHELTHTIQQGGAAQRSIADTPVGKVRRATPRVQRLVTAIPWNTSTAASTPAAGVKGGIFFVTVGGVRRVVKATSEVGATMLGERVVDQIMGAAGASANSIPVPHTDAEFQSIIAEITRHRPIPANQAYEDRLAEFSNAATLLVQTDLSQNRAMINSSVVSDIALLQNGVTLQNIGKMLAADTMIGNSDRFEQMNVGNAFLGAADVGFIDTEALMQSYQGFDQFSSGPATAQGVPGHAGKGTDFFGPSMQKSQPVAYIDFLINGGREISDKTSAEPGVAPSPNVGSIMTNLKDRWFKNNFIGKFLAYKPAPDVAQLAAAGYLDEPMLGSKAAFQGCLWYTFVWPRIKAGFDNGIADITTLMTGPGLGALKAGYDQDVQDHGATLNFDFDALLIRGNVMAAVAAGKSANDAKAEAVNYVESKLNPPSAAMVVADRVINFGVQQGILGDHDALQLRYLLPSVSEVALRENILHLRSGSKKASHKMLDKVPVLDTSYLDRRLDAARAGLLGYFLARNPFAGLGAAVQATETQAKATRKADVDQFKYFTKKGERNAIQALDDLGLNGAAWF